MAGAGWWRWLVGWSLLAAGCLTPTIEPPARDAGMYATPWPRCITAEMRAHMNRCPARRARARVEPRSCSPRPAATWPGTPAAIEPALDADVGQADGAATLAGARGDERKLAAIRRELERRLRGARGRAMQARLHYRLAFVRYWLGEPTPALDHMRRAARAAIEAELDAESMAAVERALGAMYAQAGAPQQAFVVFSSLGEPRAAARIRAVRLMRALARQLAASNRPHGAASVLRQLAHHDPEHRCHYQGRIVQVLAPTGDRAATEVEMHQLVADFRSLRIGSDGYARCGGEAAALTGALADRWKKDAQASGPGAPAAVDAAARAYGVMLDVFTQTELDRWGVCTSLAEIARTRADLLYQRQDWRACGPAYERAHAAAAGDRPLRQSALRAAQCRVAAWRERGRAQPSLDDKERIKAQLDHTQAWRDLLAATQRYLCVAPDETGDQHAQISLARAEAFYDGGATWEAAVSFRIAAFEPAAAATARHAAQRYAEAMEPLAVDDACRLDLIGDLDRLVELHCARAEDARCQAVRQVADRLRSLSGPML